MTGLLEDAFTNRAIALAWAVEPLALSVFFPPQLTFAGGAPVDPCGALALLSLPHPDSTSCNGNQDARHGTKSVEFQFIPLIES